MSENKYDPKKIEPKWQKYWEEHPELYAAKNDSDKPKKYILDMFPYPSGAGLHVGHLKGYIATDVYSRLKILQGFDILHPMGWDAFGLPAESYAIKNKMHPRIAVAENIKNFKKQLDPVGFTYDWSREINTTDPEFYKWTQWAFLKMFENGLAYEAEEPVNWCPKCKTVLANEDLENGKCERCGTQVIQRRLRQWVLRMTKYADRLLYDLDRKDLNWEDLIKEQQRNWIGRSEGTQFKMKIKDSEEVIEVYTTRLDTVFGMTYAVAAPEHEIIKRLKDSIENYKEVEEYIAKSQQKTELERTELQKEKTGVELEGVKIINPFNGEEIPLFVADYVLGFYGTGAVMAVPAHDERDWEFAKKYDLPIRQSVAPLFIGEGKNKIREDKPNTERKVVDVIIKHWKEDKYFCLDWKFNDWKSFVIGGIEEGETLEKEAIREAEEESGYKNMKVIGQVGGEIRSRFFAAHKDVNRKDLSRKCVFIELTGDGYEEPQEEHVKNHNGIWVEKEKVAEFLTLAELKIFWDIYRNGEKAITDDGIVINSDEYSNLTSEEAREKMSEWLEKNKIGYKKVNYKMRDWVFSRQRYWGEPIPIIHCEKCGTVGVPESELPVKLPEIDSYEPTDTGESPLAKITDWVNTTCPKCGGPGKRETNTMPQWAGSSWYFLRYIDPQNDVVLIDKKKEKKWMPVDLYVGGAEHATRHLLYARFWHKFLFDINAITTDEPFRRLIHVGLISAEDGRKMSKRWGNVVNPEEVIEKFGADAMRVYEMFMGPFSQNIAWSTNGVTGTYRFMEKLWKLQKKINDDSSKEKRLENLIHKTIKKVGEDIENFKFNTAISSLMILANAFEKEKNIGREYFETTLVLLSPFAPSISEELWNKLGHKESIFTEKWPEYDEKLIKDEEIELVIQVNGKVRDKIVVNADISEEEANKMATESAKIKTFIGDREIKKIIYIKGRLISIVI
ncbi:MAG: class I tRNA ligase family protein [Parcubacteria group bacterium]|jgi:leucyl-tRNA synthetase